MRGTTSGKFSASLSVGRMMLICGWSTLRRYRTGRVLINIECSALTGPGRPGSPGDERYLYASQAKTPLKHRQVCLDEYWLSFGLDEAGFVDGDGDAGGVGELAIVEAKGPAVPGADDAAVLDPSAREAPAGMGAGIVGD